MARLPQPGGDAGNWGQILNDYLSQTHNTDGTLKDNVVNAAALAPNAVTVSNVAAPGGSDGQVLVKDTAASTGLSWRTPTTNTVPDATPTVKGVLMLAGDLAGTATAPTVPALANKADSANVYTKAQVDSAVAAKLDAAQKGAVNGVASLDATGKVPSAQLPAVSSAVTSVAGRTGDVVLTKTDVGLNNVDNTSDIGKPISSATQTALNTKANQATTYTKAEVDTALAGKSSTSHTHTLDSLSDVTATGATDGQSLVFNAGAWGPATVGTGGSVVDATASTKGVVRLSGDFGGDANTPVVTGLQGVAVTATAPSNGQVLTYNGANAIWSTPSGGGGGAMNVITKNTNYTAQAGDYILLDMIGGAITITAPTPANGAVFSVKKLDTSQNNVTVVVPSGNIDGYLANWSFDVSVLDRGIAQDFLSDGTNWYLI